MFRHLLRSAPLALALTAPAALAADFVVPAGTVQVYDTSLGSLVVDRFVVEAGAVLRVRGPFAFRVQAQLIQIDGDLDLDGTDHPGVLTINVPSVPVPGANGGPGGGRGGTGSWLTTQTTPRGGQGFGPFLLPNTGGLGGESAYSTDTTGIGRRGAGGGGGVFGPAETIAPGQESRANLGRIALAGRPGSVTGFGAVSLQARPRGGGVGPAVFVDANPLNDFFGVKPQVPVPLVGELLAPIGGQGGGAGGDSVHSSVFPPLTFSASANDQGCGGGGGGGLGLLLARRIVVGPAGRVHADGGAGGGGENTQFLNRVGGGGGGGSGGMLLLQGNLIDLSQAQPDALRALGGEGGAGANDVSRAEGGGGHGGPGLVQLHVPGGNGAFVLLPGGATLADVSAPRAHVLLVQPGL